MTKETRFIVGIEDIVGVRYKCRNNDCEGEIMYRLKGKRTLIGECPVCSIRWFIPPIDRRMTADPRWSLLNVLRQILQIQTEPENLIGV